MLITKRIEQMLKDTRKALSPESVAAHLDISVQGVRRLIKSGELRAVKLGRLVRIPTAEVERLVARARRANGAKSRGAR